MDIAIVSWIFATALGLGMALLTAPRPLSATNPGLLWSGPPRRPRVPWALSLLLLFGLLCWIVGGLVGCAAPAPLLRHTVSGTWVEVQVSGGTEGAVLAWREVAKEVCDSPAPALLKMPEGHAFDRLLRTSINLDNAPPYGLYAQTLKEGTNQGTWLRCPYSDGNQGDRLWVRETWRRDDYAPAELIYAADASSELIEETRGIVRWRSPIHMPRWASRISLEVTEVRVQRLQEISEADAQAEGVDRVQRTARGPCQEDVSALSARDAFAAGWDRINGKRAPWASNPWVWAISFRRVP